MRLNTRYALLFICMAGSGCGSAAADGPRSFGVDGAGWRDRLAYPGDRLVPVHGNRRSDGYYGRGQSAWGSRKGLRGQRGSRDSDGGHGGYGRGRYGGGSSRYGYNGGFYGYPGDGLSRDRHQADRYPGIKQRTRPYFDESLGHGGRSYDGPYPGDRFPDHAPDMGHRAGPRQWRDQMYRYER